jgi:YD repeat-containing protein
VARAAWSRAGALTTATGILFLALLLGWVPPAFGGIRYLYDDLGRLVRVIRDDGEAASYSYDAVGNVPDARVTQVAKALVCSREAAASPSAMSSEIDARR